MVQIRTHKTRCPRRDFEITRIIERLRGARKSRDHETVPRSDDFIVEVRPRPLPPDREQFLARSREHVRNVLFVFIKMSRGFSDRMALDQNVLPAKFIVRIASLRRVTVRLDAVMEIENLTRIAERIVDLFFGPDVECAFCGLLMPAVIARVYNRTVRILG